MALEQKLKQLQVKINQNPLTSATILIAVLLLLLIVIPYLQVDYRGINNATQEATLENQYRVTFAQILGGVAIGIGLYYTWRRINIAENGLKVAQENLKATQEIAQDNLKATQEGQITERFTRAVDQLGAIDHLGNPAIEIRLGGIYALERISTESEKDYWPIMEILTAYIKKNSPVANAKKNKNKKVKKISLDIQAILDIIKRRENFYGSGEMNLFNLSFTNLKDADLSGANLSGANLCKANLSRADLSDANLCKANLSRADLSGAFLSNTLISKANLSRAELDGAELDGAELFGANFYKASLSGANLLSALIYDANLSGANLSDAILSAAVLSNTLISEANLSRAELDGAELDGADLSGANLSETDLSGANLEGAENLTID